MPLSVPLLIKNEYPSPHVITWIKYYHYMKIIQKLLLNDIQGQINIYKELDIKRSNGYKLLRELIDLNYIKEDSDYIKGKGHIYSFSFMKIFNDDYSDLKELNKYTNYDYSQPNINPIVKELNDNKKFLSKSEFYIPKEYKKTDKVIFNKYNIIATFITSIGIQCQLKKKYNFNNAEIKKNFQSFPLAPGYDIFDSIKNNLRFIRVKKYSLYIKIIQNLIAKEIKGYKNVLRGLSVGEKYGYQLLKELIDLNLITVEKDTYYYERGWIYSFSFEENIINPLMNNKKDLGFFIPVKGLLNEYYSFENLIFDLINNKDFFSKVKFFVPEEFNKTDKVLFTQESIIEPFILAVIIKNAMK